METTIAQNLLKNGGKIWELPEKGIKRIYIPEWLLKKMIGLDVTYYKTGNISTAKINGEKISNTCAHKILAGADGLYFDINKNSFMNKNSITKALQEELDWWVEKLTKGE